MKKAFPVFILALLLAGPSLAQTAVPCPGTGPAARYCEEVPCAAGVCTRSTTPSASEFSTAVAFYSAGKGLTLSSQKGAWLRVCAASGHTLSGTGTIRIWTWAPWSPTLVSTSLEAELDIADVWIAGACGGSSCQCVHFWDLEMGGGSSRKVIAEARSVATSGGTELDMEFFGLAVQ